MQPDRRCDASHRSQDSNASSSSPTTSSSDGPTSSSHHHSTTSEDDDSLSDTASTPSSASRVETDRGWLASKHTPQLWRGEDFRHFRKKQVVTETSLRLDINDLKQEVSNLLLLRDILASRAMVRRDDTAGSLAKTARAFYENFKNGYIPLEPISLPSKRKRAVHMVDQSAFLYSILDPAMDAGPIPAGAALMLEQWKRYTSYFKLCNFTMNSFEVVIAEEVSIVRTKGEFTMRVTEETITGIFPHLRQRRHQALLDRIMGLVLVCPCFIDLYFDAQGIVIRYDEAGDFLGAFSKVIRKPVELVELFTGALLWEAGIIGSLEVLGIDDASGDPLGAHESETHEEDREDEAAGHRDECASPPSSPFIKKLYNIDFLLNHEFMDSEEGDALAPPAELPLYEYEVDDSIEAFTTVT